MACRELIELKGLFQWTEAEMERLKEAELTRIRHTRTPVLQQTTADVQYIAADVNYEDSVVTRMQCEIEDLKALAVKGAGCGVCVICALHFEFSACMCS